jgi:hypothetical protein
MPGLEKMFDDKEIRMVIYHTYYLPDATNYEKVVKKMWGRI